MVDANLPIKLLVKSINTMVYFKNWSLSAAIYKGIIILIQDFH